MQIPDQIMLSVLYKYREKNTGLLNSSLIAQIAACGLEGLASSPSQQGLAHPTQNSFFLGGEGEGGRGSMAQPCSWSQGMPISALRSGNEAS